MKFWKKFYSSNTVLKAEYDDKKQILTVEYRAGTYEYYEVPLSTWEGLKEAISPGSYIHSSIKGKFEYKKLD